MRIGARSGAGEGEEGESSWSLYRVWAWVERSEVGACVAGGWNRERDARKGRREGQSVASQSPPSRREQTVRLVWLVLFRWRTGRDLRGSGNCFGGARVWNKHKDHSLPAEHPKMEMERTRKERSRGQCLSERNGVRYRGSERQGGKEAGRQGGRQRCARRDTWHSRPPWEGAERAVL